MEARTAAAATPAAEPLFQMGGSIPALLAEEWMVQPWTILPTFFEVFLVQQAQAILSTTAESTLLQLRDKVRGLSIRLLQSSKNEFVSSTATTTSATGTFRWLKLSGPGRLNYNTLLVSKALQMLQVLDTLLTKYSREIIFCFRYCLERQSLRMNSATVSESLYGLKRSTVANRTTGQLQSQLDASERLALISVLLPYVLSRVRDLSPRNRLQHKLLSIAKGSFMIHHVVDVAFLYNYMIGSTHYTSWINYWLRHVVRRISQAESDPTARTTDNATTIDRSSVLVPLQKRAYNLLLSTAALSFTLQIISWYRRTFPAIPEPPQQHQINNEIIKPGCPICHSPSPIDPTVVPITGLVYCGRCIARQVRIHRACPITKLPLQQHHLQRLYEPK